ncbi:polyprotein of EF-Ts, chloroplastic-like [Mangifera indica]|uniref:polyprotein of EF-Ts, chloroplastic-like n=1 Tax=Mangifera indica TaxID=29780 RepID=UPI001CF967D1|nr:polyprotein of EF-Ts, chloroplastic-like [Mangifera indica]
MMPVIPCSIGNISPIPVKDFMIKNNNCLTRCSSTRRSGKRTISSTRYVLPLSSSVRIFSQYQRGGALHGKSRIHILSATGVDVAVEGPGSPAADEGSSGASDIPSDVVETSETSSTISDASTAPAQSKRSRPVRKSEMPPVKDEELIPGATFTGKVRSIQPFGAFVDFGAFTDGLVHVSRLSDSFVKDVGSFVSVGQEVKVRLIEANTETGRISLTMRKRDDISNLQQEKDAPTSSEKARPTRRSTSKPNQKRDEVKTTKFVKGQDLEGTVKNLVRAGAFISLPEGEEGFLPTSEESDDGLASMMGGSSLQVGQEVSVRVLRISRGQVTLTMKKEEDAELDVPLTDGVVHVATNPFVLAFRQNKEIAAFLDERDKIKKVKEPNIPKEIEGEANQTEVKSSISEVQEQLEVSAPSALDVLVENDEVLLKEEIVGADTVSDSSGSVDGALQTMEKETEESRKSLAPEGSVSIENQTIEESSSTNISEEVEVNQTKVKSSISEAQEQPEFSAPSSLDEPVENEEILLKEEIMGADMVSDLSESVDGALQTMEKETEESSQSLAPEGSVSAENQTTEESSSTNISDSSDTVSEVLLKEEIVGADTVSDSSESVDGALQTLEKNTEDGSKGLGPEGSVSTENQTIEESSSTNISEEIAKQVLSSENPKDEVVESKSDDSMAKDEVPIQTPSAEIEIATAAPAEDEEAGSTPDKNGGVSSSVVQPRETKAGEVGENSDPSGESAVKQTVSSGNQVIEEVVESQVYDTKDEVQIQAPAAETEVATTPAVEDEKTGPDLKKNDNVENSNGQPEVPSPKENVITGLDPAETEVATTPAVEDEKTGPNLKKNDNVENSNGQPEVPSPKENVITASISPALVKQLREETGAGMMDCKKALAETGGDIVKAQEFLRKKGLASAEKKATRATAEGRIGSYIHDSRIGILVEVNCETDFVSRGDIFKELVDDLAMQVAACPQVQYVVTEDVPQEIVNKEKEIEMQKEDLLSKPEQIRSKIVEGRIRKRLEELALLEQPYIKNDKVVVKDWVKQNIATIGENIKVRRFVRYNLGEGLEKKSQDFAAEVAAQTAAKSVIKDQPAAVEKKETVDKPPASTISAALVKQLREETGAGMMDCKKALSETGGDLEKAQEYLRKKGLAAADKKSSRLAAEGRIGSYIHDSRIGVLIEVNCETDFVGRSEKFKELVDDLAMQVVACPQVQFVSIEDISQDIINKEKEIEMQREDLLSKPENIREKIVEGRITKRLGEFALLEQPFIKDDKILVKDLVKQTVAALGENIKVRRFVRFTLGEATEDDKKKN